MDEPDKLARPGGLTLNELVRVVGHGGFAAPASGEVYGLLDLLTREGKSCHSNVEYSPVKCSTRSSSSSSDHGFGGWNWRPKWGLKSCPDAS